MPSGIASRLSAAREGMRTSLWPLPLCMGGLAVLMWLGAQELDKLPQDARLPYGILLHSGTGDDARNLLTGLMTALLGLAGVMFSITMVVLSLAANQFGSRLVRTYTSDLRTQAALGTFTMAIVYMLLALGVVEKDMPASEVPHFTVAGGLILAFVCLVVLLQFLSIVARLMVADEVIERVGAELEQSVAALPTVDGPPPPVESDADKVSHDLAQACEMVRSTEEGYVQAIEYEKLVELARAADVVIQLDYRAGAFMCRDGWLARVYPAAGLTPDIAAGIQRHIMIGNRRTPTQDLEFPIRHLVDIALRALSPGINDPNTAIVVIDRLRGALSRLMAKRLPGAVYRDDRGCVRILARRSDIGGILKAAFHQIRQAGAEKPDVAIHLLGSIARLAEHVRSDEQRHALLLQARMTAAACLRVTSEQSDRDDVEKALAAVERKLRQVGPNGPAACKAQTGLCPVSAAGQRRIT